LIKRLVGVAIAETMAGGMVSAATETLPHR
jgi:hypothetical protein